MDMENKFLMIYFISEFEMKREEHEKTMETLQLQGEVATLQRQAAYQKVFE